MPRSSSGGKMNYDMWMLARRMNQLVDEWMHAKFRGDPDETWEPAVDIIECETLLCILADLAGMDQNDIDIRIEGRAITLAGVRTLQKVDGPVQVHQMELPRGPFRRTLQMPFDVPVDDLEIDYESGLLRICMPKPAAGRPNTATEPHIGDRDG